MKKVLLVLTFLFNVVLALANVDSVLKVEKMEMTNGTASYSQVTNTNPGDTLVYTLTVTNNTDGVVKNITPSIPVPEYTTLVASLVTPNDSFTVSTNNTDYVVYPYVGADGRPVADSMYKSIRWTVDTMEPNETKVFKFGVQVN